MDNRQFALDQAVKYFAKGAVTNNVQHVLDTAERFMVFLNNQQVVDNSQESVKLINRRIQPRMGQPVNADPAIS